MVIPIKLMAQLIRNKFILAQQALSLKPLTLLSLTVNSCTYYIRAVEFPYARQTCQCQIIWLAREL